MVCARSASVIFVRADHRALDGAPSSAGTHTLSASFERLRKPTADLSQGSPHLGFQLRKGGGETVQAREQSDLPLETTRGLPLARGFVVAVEATCRPGPHNAVVSCLRVLASSGRRNLKLPALEPNLRWHLGVDCTV